MTSTKAAATPFEQPAAKAWPAHDKPDSHTIETDVTTKRPDHPTMRRETPANRCIRSDTPHLARGCRQLELVVIAAALAKISGLELTAGAAGVDRHGTTPTLEMLADALTDPPGTVAERTNMAHRRVIDESRDIALALARLVDPHGDLGGMFAGHTTLTADTLAELTVVDIAQLYRTNRAALPLVMICTASWLQLATTVTARGRWQLNDEAWALMADDATARFTQTNQKLARQLGISVVNILHRLSDTAAAGPAGSTTRALAEGAIADSGTWIIYRQRPSEIPLLRDTLDLNDLQARLTTRLPRGRGLWIVAGDRRETTLVDHLLSDTETALVDTDTAMHAADQPAPTAGGDPPHPTDLDDEPDAGGSGW
jgi:hypothetical protein